MTRCPVCNTEGFGEIQLEPDELEKAWYFPMKVIYYYCRNCDDGHPVSENDD